MAERELADLARKQHGIVTRTQALACLSESQIKRRLVGGQFELLLPGVYRLAGAPVTWRQGLVAACRAVGPEAVASHRSAARLWAMPGVWAEEPEIVVPLGRVVRRPGVRAHRSNLLTAGFVTVHDGIPVTTPARTLVDLSAVVHPYLIERVADDALRRRLLTLGEWHACFNAMAKRGRRRVAWLRPVLEARPLAFAAADSGRESALARMLVEAGLPRPVPQFQVTAGGRVFLLDLAYPEQRVAVEYDGWLPHSTRLAFDHDRARDNALKVLGWTVLRFTSRSAPHEIVRTVRQALNLRHAG